MSAQRRIGRAATPGPPRRAGGCSLVLLLALVSGCGTTGGGSRSTSRSSGEGVSEFHVVTFPVALNLDARPGPDGFALKLFAVGPRDPKSVRLPGGTVELSLYDGLVTGGETNPPAPLRSWTFTPAQLKQFEQEAVIGVHYQFTLRWNSPGPTQERVTVMGRYHEPGGRVVAAAPSVVSVSTGP